MSRSGFFLLFAFLLYQQGQVNGYSSAAVYVCNVNDRASANLIDYRQQLLCDGTSKSLCTIQNNFTSQINFTNNVIVAHSGQWADVNKIVTKLSMCHVPYLILDMDESTFDIGHFCSYSRNTLVVSTSNSVLNFFSVKAKNSKQACSAKFVNEDETFFETFVETCPLSIWVAGTNNDCGSQSFVNGLKFTGQIYNAYNDTSRTLEKTVIKQNIIVGTLKYIPFSGLVNVNGSMAYRGVLIEIMNKVSTIIGHDYTIVESTDAGVMVNKDWSGLMGMLLNKDIDVIAGPLTVTFKRSQYVDFSPPFYYESVGILVEKPEMIPRLWRVFTLFTVPLWAVIFVACIFTVALLYFLHLFAPTPTLARFRNLADCVWYVVASMSNQAHEINPGCWAAQTYLAFWWLYIIAIIAIYSGVLISLLTNKKISLDFEDLSGLADMVKGGDYKICVQSGTGFYDMLTTSNDPNHIALKNFLYANPQYVTTSDKCVEYLMNTKKMAFLAEVTRLQEIQKQQCAKKQLIVMNDRFYPGWFGFAFRKDSPLGSMMSEVLSEVYEYGLIDGWKVKFSSKLKGCRIITEENMNSDDDTGNDSLNMDPLTLLEVGGPFVLLTVGFVISIISFAIEKARKSNHEKSMQKMPVPFDRNIKSADQTKIVRPMTVE